MKTDYIFPRPEGFVTKAEKWARKFSADWKTFTPNFDSFSFFRFKGHQELMCFLILKTRLRFEFEFFDIKIYYVSSLRTLKLV